MEISEATQNALIIAVPTFLAAVGTLVVQIINAAKATKKIDAVIATTATVQAQTDGHLSKMTKQLETANETIADIAKETTGTAGIVRKLYNGGPPIAPVKDKKREPDGTA